MLTIQNNRFHHNNRPIDLWGIRTASATKNDALCDHLIAHLDDYIAHGVNAVTVFYAGCRGASYDAFSPDGATLDPGHHARMERIITECARREMIVIAGIFYQAAPFGLRDADSVRRAVRTVTTSLKPHRDNVILNIANEPNSGEWGRHAAVWNFRDPQCVIDLCAVAHETDPDRIVGAGGYDPETNILIGRSEHVDTLLFDTAGNQDSGQLHDRYLAAGVTDKPMVNVETFGAWTKRFMPRGVFPDEVKQAYFDEIDRAAARPGLGLFFHNNPWCQIEPMRYDLAGQGTESDPGIRWYFEYVRERIKR